MRARVRRKKNNPPGVSRSARTRPLHFIPWEAHGSRVVRVLRRVTASPLHKYQLHS